MQNEISRLYLKEDDMVPMQMLGFVLVLTLGIVILFGILN